MLKVAVIGGGSTYTPELLQGFLDLGDEFPLDELWLMDIDQTRLSIVGDFAQRIAAAQNARFKIVLSTNQLDAIRDASYVITQTRVGRMNARRNDEYLGKRHRLIGQETTGVGGMANALRTIPVILDVAHNIEQTAPGALLINFANPAGLVTEAVFRYAPGVKAVGVCNVAIGVKMELLEHLNRHLDADFHPHQAEVKCLGLNHLTWFYGFTVNGQDYWPQIMEMLLEEMESQEDPLFDTQTLQQLNMFPNYYLRYYYYTDKIIASQEDWPPSRAEEVAEIEADLLEQFQDHTRVTLPDEMMKRGGAHYSTVAAQLLDAIHNDLNRIQVLNVRQSGSVAGWSEDWVLEMPCKVSRKGIQPLPVDPLPPVCEGLVAQVKAYEILTVQAAVHGDRGAAYQALLAHPLGPPADKIQAVLDDMLDTNRAYLPQFFS